MWAIISFTGAAADTLGKKRRSLAGAANQEFGLSQGSMGLDLGDYNGDGQADIFVTNFELENNVLYQGDGDAYFVDATLKTGLQGPCFRYVGFGAALADFDGDTWPDLLVINGNVYYTLGQGPYKQPAFVFRNTSGARFENVSQQGGPYFGAPHAGRGVAVGDLNDDGALDIVIVHQNDPVTLLRNRKTPSRWVRIHLEGVQCDREAIGAVVSLKTAGRQVRQWARSGAGYLSQFDPRLLFSVEEDSPATVTVTWPGGNEEIYRNLELRATHRLVQGEGEPPQSD